MIQFKGSAERRKTSFLKETVENADLHKAISNKTMTTQEKCVKCDLVAPLRTNLTRSLTQKTIKIFPVITKPFEPSLFPHCAKAWRNLRKELRDIYSINRFKRSILNFVWPIGNSVFAFHDINGVKLQARLRLVFSHLNKHECQRNFNHIKRPK